MAMYPYEPACPDCRAEAGRDQAGCVEAGLCKYHLWDRYKAAQAESGVLAAELHIQQDRAILLEDWQRIHAPVIEAVRAWAQAKAAVRARGIGALPQESAAADAFWVAARTAGLGEDE